MTLVDWCVLTALCLLSLGVGVVYTLREKARGEEGFFTANRSLSWWAVGISNSATYQSGLGAFVMLIFVFGLAGNWLWWTSWVIWMPLVAVIWARMWRRMQIVTTAELIGLRYGGRAGTLARRIYAVAMFAFAVTLVGYITGFFAKTISPVLPMSETQILLLFGGVTVIYTMLGGLMGSVVVAVVQFVIMMAGSVIFLILLVPQHGGWTQILDRVREVRPDALTALPVTDQIPLGTILMFVLLGFFFAGSPTAGEGMTAQRFMAARSERHAMGGQIFNAFIALSVRIIPLVGLGIVCLSLFWSDELVETVGSAPQGVTMLEDPAHAWGALVNASALPPGFTGLLVATEVAAFMSTLSALINWGSSFLVHDLYRPLHPGASERNELWTSRIVTVLLFVLASVLAVFFVDDMVSWFLFINSVVVIFWLPLAYFRFFWERFNVWGELAATVLGLPVAVFIWFILGFEEAPFWVGSGILFVTAMGMLLTITLLTPPEKEETRVRFYERCRPPVGWRSTRRVCGTLRASGETLPALALNSVLGIVACLGMAVGTNAVFLGNGLVFALGAATALTTTGWLLARLSNAGQP